MKATCAGRFSIKLQVILEIKYGIYCRGQHSWYEGLIFNAKHQKVINSELFLKVHKKKFIYMSTCPFHESTVEA